MPWFAGGFNDLITSVCSPGASDALIRHGVDEGCDHGGLGAGCIRAAAGRQASLRLGGVRKRRSCAWVRCPRRDAGTTSRSPTPPPPDRAGLARHGSPVVVRRAHDRDDRASRRAGGDEVRKQGDRGGGAAIEMVEPAPPDAKPQLPDRRRMPAPRPPKGLARAGHAGVVRRSRSRPSPGSAWTTAGISTIPGSASQDLRPQEIARYVSERTVRPRHTARDWIEEPGGHVVSLANCVLERTPSCRHGSCSPSPSPLAHSVRCRPGRGRRRRARVDGVSGDDEAVLEKAGVKAEILLSYGATEAKIPDIADVESSISRRRGAAAGGQAPHHRDES